MTWSRHALARWFVVIGVLGTLGPAAGAACSSRAQGPATVTFTKDVAPIVFQQCSTCHRPGELGPFSLLTYDDVRQHARQIAAVTKNHVMPPWKPEPPEPGGVPFVGERRLTDQQIHTQAYSAKC